MQASPEDTVPAPGKWSVPIACLPSSLKTGLVPRQPGNSLWDRPEVICRGLQQHGARAMSATSLWSPWAYVRVVAPI